MAESSEDRIATVTKQLKSILKNPTSIELATANRASSKQAVDARALAVQHAEIIQHRKDLEREILDSIVTLSEYPQVRTGGASAAAPAAPDVADFKNGVRLFQPSDYDALVEERNANGLCGYALCPRPRVKHRGGGEWKIVNGGIAQRKEIEKWCSKDCAKRALYVKVQLNETAAWERAGIPEIEIDLLGEEKLEDVTTSAVRELQRLRLQDERKAAGSSALALERGDPGTNPGTGLVKLTIREKETKPPKQGASDVYELGNEDHLVLEGHKTKFGFRPPPEDDS